VAYREEEGYEREELPCRCGCITAVLGGFDLDCANLWRWMQSSLKQKK
jgi:hypothetical protein